MLTEKYENYLNPDFNNNLNTWYRVVYVNIDKQNNVLEFTCLDIIKGFCKYILC